MPIAVVGGLLIVGMNQGRSERSELVPTSIGHAITAVQIKSSTGDVKVSTGARAGTLELTRRLPRDVASSGYAADQRWDGTTLVLTPEANCGSSKAGCSIDYSLEVPEGTRITVETGSGDVQLDGTLGVIAAKTGSGDVELDDLRSASVSASTGSGDIDVSLKSAPDTLNLATGSGDVKAKLPEEATYDVVKSTRSGDEKVDIQTSSTSVHKVKIDTGSGDIELKPR